jgi:hypothetical protein
MTEANCECGWLLSQQGTCANPDHGQIMLEHAAQRALSFLSDFHSDNQREVIEDLRNALGNC